jgi:hypothetical protein
LKFITKDFLRYTPDDWNFLTRLFCVYRFPKQKKDKFVHQPNNTSFSPTGEAADALPTSPPTLPISAATDATSAANNKRSTLPTELPYLNATKDKQLIKKAFVVENELVQMSDSPFVQNPVKFIKFVRGRTEDGTEILIDFQKFKLDQYRKLATLLGIKRSSSN